ncbi:hypothetical protein [Priestia koreensis]|uniref:Uncharacterized protein n=1 Tax=Priestia koreensis TaxID=284581 RepID=A0A0M0L6K4_9BACI|nr:hypothetical protein [Priestia koreensis]KOO46477.1 hypothetical protein AMD01_11675 [Priestia koreensis]
MQKFGLTSVLILVLSVFIYIASLFGRTVEFLPGKALVFLLILLSISGVLLAFKCTKGQLQLVGVLGNVLVLLIGGVIPVTSMLM